MELPPESKPDSGLQERERWLINVCKKSAPQGKELHIETENTSKLQIIRSK